MDAAKKEIDAIRTALGGPWPNKTPDDKDKIDRLKKALKKALERLKKSEEHARTGQGYR